MKMARFGATCGLLAASIVGAASAANAAPYQHVLLISVDGLHALDVANYIAANPASALAGLARTGVFYPSALTPAPSDSFPGMLALVTGGTPRSTGVFYDDSYDRTFFAPGSDCKGTPGAEVAFAENLDFDSTKLDGGGKPGDVRSQINPANLPRALVNGECRSIYPHEFVRVNSVFEIAKAHGGHTAWSDKHPAYEILNGPSGAGIDDLYALEQDSLIEGTKVKTTGSFKAERDFDEARVKAILNEIAGRDSTGSHAAPVPAIFGMNFQAVSVGQKLPKAGPGDDAGLVGGYADVNGTPSNGLALQLGYVDDALGRIKAALKANKLDDSTLIVIASKHGQSPIDPATFRPLDDEPYTKTPGYAFHIADDASLIWLKPEERSKQLAAAADYLKSIIGTVGIGSIATPSALALQYADPAGDSRTPDFVVTVDPGVVYTSGSKIAEHGGANWNDRNVALLVSSPSIKQATVPVLVQTTEVAPTILKALGYDPKELQAVKLEGTPELPGLAF